MRHLGTGKAGGGPGISLPSRSHFSLGFHPHCVGCFLNKWRRPDWRRGQRLPENRPYLLAGSVSLLYVHACTHTPTCTHVHTAGTRNDEVETTKPAAVLLFPSNTQVPQTLCTCPHQRMKDLLTPECALTKGCLLQESAMIAQEGGSLRASRETPWG